MIPRNGRSGNSGFSRKTWRGIGAALMALAIFVCLSSLPAQAQHYEAEESDLSNPCGSLSAPLTGSFTPDPCTLTRDRRRSDLRFAHDYYGGQQLVEYLDNWWETEFLPALKDLTKQLSVSKVKQTLDLTMARDGSRILETRATIEKEKLEALRDKVVNDQVVIGETPKTGVVAGQKLSNNLTRTMTQEIAQRPETMSTAPIKNGPALNHKSRWENYCQLFRDPRDNNGADGCIQTGSSGGGRGSVQSTNANLKDGDIDIEGFMLQDSIDLRDEHKHKTALTLLQNITHHKPNFSIPPDAINSTAGRESILKQQHIEAVRSVAADVVAAIMTRRSTLILPKVTRDSPVTSIPGTFPVLSGEILGGWEEYKDKLATYECASGWTCINWAKCIGRYQFCPYGGPPLIDNGNLPGGCYPFSAKWYGTCFNSNSIPSFLGCPECQDNALYVLTARKWANMVRSGVTKYIGQTITCDTGEKVYITPSGLIGGAHLRGEGGPRNPVKGIWAMIFKGSCRKNVDGNGTPITKYVKGLAGFTIPFDPREFPSVDGDTFFQAPSVSVAELIRDIRKKAGVSDDRISANTPSYNEVMLAMTKERFFDPEYFTKIREGKISLLKEQSSIDSYISIQYQDIYQLQEQINALLAARAALKINQDQKPNQVQSTPLKN